MGRISNGMRLFTFQAWLQQPWWVETERESCVPVSDFDASAWQLRSANYMPRQSLFLLRPARLFIEGALAREMAWNTKHTKIFLMIKGYQGT